MHYVWRVLILFKRTAGCTACWCAVRSSSIPVPIFHFAGIRFLKLIRVATVLGLSSTVLSRTRVQVLYVTSMVKMAPILSGPSLQGLVLPLVILHIAFNISFHFRRYDIRLEAVDQHISHTMSTQHPDIHKTLRTEKC